MAACLLSVNEDSRRSNPFISCPILKLCYKSSEVIMSREFNAACASFGYTGAHSAHSILNRTHRAKLAANFTPDSRETA